MKKLPVYLIPLFLLISTCIQAQISNFIFSPHSLMGAQTNIPQGTIVPDSIYLKNIGPASSYLGTIVIQTSLENPVTPTTFIPISTDSFPNVFIHDSTYFQFPLHQTYSTVAQGGKYRIGNNVIVVWPILNNTGMSHDTIRDTVYINSSFAGISKLDVNDLFWMYPNPSHSFVHIGIESVPTRAIAEVRLFDMKGRLVNSYLKQEIIDVGDLPKGMYFVEVLFSDGTVGRRKLLME
jgi:hypothetical protein